MSSSTTAKYVYVLAFLSPVLAAYFAIRNLAWEYRKGILILIITFFGATIILQTADGSVLQQMIYSHYVGLGFERWLFELKEMLLFSPEPGTKGDLFSHVSSYLIGEVLGVPEHYFMFVSFVYGYFFINALSQILRWDTTQKRDIFFWTLIVIFVSYRFVDNLQTVRTWTGLWVLFNGVYGFHRTRQLKYIFLILMAPLFHLAYFIIAIPAIIALLSSIVSPKIFIVVYVLSFLIEIGTSKIIEQLETTDLGKEKVAGYYRENPDEYGDPMADKSTNWYKVYGKEWALPNGPHFIAIALIAFGMFSRSRMNGLEIGLFSTGLLLGTLANLGDFVPAFYNRTMINAGIYIIATMVLLVLRHELFNTTGLYLVGRKLAFWIALLVFSPYLVYVIANMLQFTSVFMVSFPFFGFIGDENMSIREFITYILKI